MTKTAHIFQTCQYCRTSVNEADKSVVLFCLPNEFIIEAFSQALVIETISQGGRVARNSAVIDRARETSSMPQCTSAHYEVKM